jgi:hypothetical protein
MNALLVNPSDDQRQLLRVIWESRLSEGAWPIYDFVERTLYQQGIRPNAWTVISECPWVRLESGFSHYGWTWQYRGLATAPPPDDLIGLSVLGLFHAGALYEAGMFIGALRYLVHAEQQFAPSPKTVPKVEVSAADIAPSLFPRPPLSGVTGGIRAADLALLGDLLRREPSTRAYMDQTLVPADGNWTVTPKPFIRAYEGIKDIEGYAERLVAELSPPRAASLPETVSSLALPEAIDYLNAIWHLRFHQELFGIPRCTAAVELTHDCQTSLDFDSRVTALYGIFSQIRIPGGTKNGKPTSLKKFLARHPTLKGQPAATAAVEVMETFLKARAWRQHVDAVEGIAAMGQLGVKLPTEDWEGAWRTIRARMVESVNALREQVDLLPIPAVKRQ